MVMNEMPYIVEWIEFMRLQGVDRFIIYNDDSTDNVVLLRDFYLQRGEVNVHVLQRPGRHGDQNVAFHDCHARFGNTTTWMMISDTDEYFFSPRYGTVRDALNKMPPTVSVVHGNCVRYGTNGKVHRFRYALRRGLYGLLQYENECGQQILATHTHHGPDKRLSKEQGILEEKLLATLPGCAKKPGWNVCYHGPGKSIFRPEMVKQVDIHQPALYNGSYSSYMIDVRCNHFYLRTKDDAMLKAQQWHKEDPKRMFEDTDVAFWSAAQDDDMLRWVPALKARMLELAVYPVDPHSQEADVCQ